MTPEQAAIVFADCKRAYQLAFGTDAGQAVLQDLKPFCRIGETCAAFLHSQAPIDVHRTFVLIGRNDVYNRIRDYLDLTVEQLVERYTRPAQGATSHD